MSTQQLKAAATGKNVANAGQNPKTIHGFLEQYKSEIARALPKHMTADRMARIALTEFRKTPALMKCDPATLFGAVIQCAQLGLEPGGALGHAYLLPFENRKKGTTDVQFIVGYRGMIDLARRSGQIVSISARAVHANDEFTYEFGLHEDLRHKPDESGNPGALTHVYAVARLKDGGVQFDVMSKAEIDKVRALSKASGSGPWVTFYEEMAKKTVIRRLFKYLPVSIEMATAVGLDERVDAGLGQDNEMVIEGVATVSEDQDEAPASVDTETSEVVKEQAPFGLKDAFSAVEAGDFELARDIARSLDDAAKKDIETAIAKREAK